MIISYHPPMALKRKTVDPAVEEHNFLECGICLQNFRDPRGLPCLHAFCCDCLEKWTESSVYSNVIICPVCNKKTETPGEGVRGFPSHFIVKNLQEAFQKQNVQSQKQKTYCSNCDKPDKEIKFHCFDCKEHLCEACCTNHSTFKIMKDHKIVTIEDLQSGKETDEGRICKEHGEIVRYYCETEQKQVCQDCVSLKTCPIEHDRCSLKAAAKKQTAIIEELIMKYNDTKEKCRIAVKKSDEVREVFKKAEKEARSALEKAKREYIHAIEQIFLKHDNEITEADLYRTKEIGDKQQQLEKHLMEMNKVIQQGLTVIQSKSDYQITSAFASLKDTLKNQKEQPVAAEDTLGYLKFETFSPVIHVMDYLSVAKVWKLNRQFSTSEELDKVQGIAFGQYGGIVVTSEDDGVKVFTRDGHVKFTFEDISFEVYDIAVTPDNRYIVDGRKKFLCYDSQGNDLSETSTYDMDDSPSDPHSVAVDTKGRIIVGLQNQTISIHHADGTFIRKCSTDFNVLPGCLAATSKDQLVYFDTTLKLMDYAGGNVRNISPPPDVVHWYPGNVNCCHKYNELFVSNVGVPRAIYRYTSDGEYLGLVTTEVDDPKGIAVSEGGQELIVAETSENMIKIFQRQ